MKHSNLMFGLYSSHTTILLILLFNFSFLTYQSLVPNTVETQSNNVYFRILHPEPLRYTFKARQALNFGAPFNETYDKITLIVVEPNNACSTFVNKFELQNNIGLVERGGCSFLEKCIEAERNGLKAILIHDNRNQYDEDYLDMITDSTKRNCSIPAAFILGKDGIFIRRQMIYLGLERVTINIPVNITSLSYQEQESPPYQ